MAAVALHVADLERSLPFWQGALQLRTNFDTGWTSDPDVFAPSGVTGASAVRFVNLAAPDAPTLPPGPNQPSGITLMQVKGVERRGVTARFQDPGTMHVTLWVDELAARVQRFVDAGYSLRGPITRSVVGEGVRIAMIDDPDGFTLELIGAG